MASPEKQISTLRKVDRGTTVAKIAMLITRLCSRLNIDRNMNSSQIAMCAEEIVNEKWMLKLDDVDLCFRLGLQGQYGEIYNRIDQTIIFTWLNKYQTQRDQAFARRHDEGRAGNLYQLFDNEPMKQILHEVTDKLIMQKKPGHTPEPRPQNAASLFAQQVADEFETLYRDNPSTSTPRMVFYKDAWRDQSNFYDLRFIEHDEEQLKQMES